jgi:hypothetical protein
LESPLLPKFGSFACAGPVPTFPDARDAGEEMDMSEFVF